MKKAFTLITLLFLFFQTGLVNAQTKQLAFEDLQNTRLSPKTLQNIQWIGLTDQFTYIAVNTLIKGSTTIEIADTLMRISELNQYLKSAGMDEVKRFPSIRWMDEYTFTFTLKNKLLLFDTRAKKLRTLNSWDEKAANTDINYNTSNVAFTRGNNLFISIKGLEVQVTSDTAKGIVNGSERVHRNEWGISKGTFWSPQGNLLAYYRMDERMVKEYPLVDIEPGIAEVKNTRYPMAGEASHEVTVAVYDLAGAKTVFLKTGSPKDQFLTNICWSPDEKYIFIAVLNRAQDHMWFNQYNALTGDLIKTLFEETNPRYVEPMHPAVFMKSHTDQFIWQSQRDGWNHLYLYDISGKLLRQVTKGNWQVSNFYGFDKDENCVFISSNKETPVENQVYSVNLKAGELSRLSSVQANHTAYFSPGGGGFIDYYGSVQIASEYALRDKNGKLKYLLQKNENPLREYKMGEISIFPIKANDGTDLYCRLIKPPGFDPAKKYPVIIYVYGGPHDQMVTNNWLGGAGLFLNYLATKGYLVFTLDNRGSPNRGFEFESCIHRNLGVQEMKDQMEGVKYLRTLPYVDTTRMGVDGWSYGGFMTIMMMLKNPGLFKVAVAGGPVIDWKYYEVMYGERYMDTPRENPEGYKNACLLNYAGNLRGKLLVIHGTVDETVVWQNSLKFIKKCIDEGKQVDYFVYPGHEHNVRGKDRLHLYKKLEMYFDENLK